MYRVFCRACNELCYLVAGQYRSRDFFVCLFIFSYSVLASFYSSSAEFFIFFFLDKAQDLAKSNKNAGRGS